MEKLQERLTKEVNNKQIELEETQMKLKAYLEKAKIVIQSLDPSKNSAASEAEIQYLKSSNTEKDKIIKQLTVSTFISF